MRRREYFSLSVAKIRCCVRLPEKPAWLSICFCPIQISLSQEDLQALGSAVSVVIQSSALAMPEEELVGGDMHTMTVVNADGIETQPVRAEARPSLFPAEGLPARRESHFLF